MKFIFMLGGQGTKLWPVSRDHFPKQFNKIIGEKSLFQMNLEDLLTKYSAQDIYFSTSELYLEYVRSQAPMIPESNYIIEPHLRRDTGPASSYSMAHMLVKHPNETVMFYVQPVVIREPREKYLEFIEGLEKIVEKYSMLTTGGKYPEYPETGSDYLELGEKIDVGTSFDILRTKRWVERPKTLDEATEMLNTMKLSLHCNHWTWKPEPYFDALKTYKPDWYRVSMELISAIKSNESANKITEIYSKFETAKVENFTQHLANEGNIAVAILPFNWRHITTWNDIYEYLLAMKGSAIQGFAIEEDSEGNLILNQTSKLIGTLGLKNMVVVQTEDATLICPRNDCGKMRDLLSRIKGKGQSQYL